MFCARVLAASVDVVGAVLGLFLVLLRPSWGPLGGFLGFFWALLGSSWVLLGQANGSTGQRVDGTTGNGPTESGSVAGSGAQPLLDNKN